VIFAGAILGITAALLWSAQGAIMMSYPLEKDKGKSFGVFWAIFPIWYFYWLCYRPRLSTSEVASLAQLQTSTYIDCSNFFAGSDSNTYLPTGLLDYHLFWYRICFPCSTSNRVIRLDGTIVKLETSTSLHNEFSSLWNV